MLPEPFDEAFVYLHVADDLLTKAIVNYRGEIELNLTDLAEIRSVVRLFRRLMSEEPRLVSSKQVRALLSYRNFNPRNPHGLEAAAMAISLAIRAVGQQQNEWCVAMRFALSQAVREIESMAYVWGTADNAIERL
jgi:hypothetical protein